MRPCWWWKVRERDETGVAICVRASETKRLRAESQRQAVVAGRLGNREERHGARESRRGELGLGFFASLCKEEMRNCGLVPDRTVFFVPSRVAYRAGVAARRPARCTLTSQPRPKG
jgi:hypothetical protein